MVFEEKQKPEYPEKNNQYLPICDAKSGSPQSSNQGSILGTLFFVLFINDLPDVVCSASTIALYADHSKMFRVSRVINCDDDQMLFQNDLNKLYHWSQRNLMDCNSKKCKITRITKKQVPFANRVHLSDTVLEKVKGFKGLGILTDNGLSWNSHIDMITAARIQDFEMGGEFL